MENVYGSETMCYHLSPRFLSLFGHIYERLIDIRSCKCNDKAYIDEAVVFCPYPTGHKRSHGPPETAAEASFCCK